MEAKGIIRLREVLQQMDAAIEPFQISFVTANKRKKEGGRIENYPACLTTGNRIETKGTTGKAVKQSAPDPNPSEVLRNPDHFTNATRNLVLLPSKQIRKVHIWLIITFNGQKVII